MIDIKNLEFSYSKQPLFKNLHFELTTGSIAGLLGKNGAGKTTLLKVIAGLIHPKSGSVQIAGHQPKKRQPSFLQQVFFVPEEFYLPPVNIKQFIKANSTLYPTFDHDLMTRLITEFDLVTDASIHHLSYGQKKKFLISFALSTKCQLLILDEPTNGLDIPSKSAFRKILAGSLDDHQLVIISTHQVKDIETLIDRVFILDSGKMILCKEIADLASELRFTISTETTDPEILYSELGPGGHHAIKRAKNGNSTAIDLELLFNACCNGINLFHDHENK